MANHTKLNKKEKQALYGKRHFLRSLYIFGIRQYMDYTTGITGMNKRRISWQSLCEELYVEPESGVSSDEVGTPHESRVRRAADQLEKIGLLRKIPHHRYLIFECLLASRGKFVQKQADKRPTPQADKEADSVAPPEYKTFQSQADTQAEDQKPPIMAQGDTPPESGIELIQEKRWADDKSDNYCPTEGEWQQLLIDRGFQLHFVWGKPKVVEMVKGWVKSSVNISQARTAFDCAESNLQGMPASPMYYHGFVREVVLAQKQQAEAPLTRSSNYAPRKPNVRTNATRTVLETCIAVSQHRANKGQPEHD